MKIAMIGQKGIPARFGGVETHVEKLAARLGARGHEVTVYTRAWYAAPASDFAPGVRTVLTPSVPTKHLDAITHTLTSTLHALADQPDVIHYHGVGPSLLSWIPRLFAPRTRVVATFHSIDRKHQKWGPLARTALGLGEWTACRLPHATVAISKGLRSYCFDRYSRDLRYIPNGVDVPACPYGTTTLAPLGLESGRYLVTTGRLIRLKGIHHLIAAFLKTKAAGATNGMKLAIVGDSARSDDYVRELKAMAGGDADIVFTGYRHGREMEELLAHAYAAVHPSETEGLSLSVLEEMAHGKTVLASDIPGNTEALGHCGVTFRNKDVYDLATKLALLIADPAYAAANGAASRERVKSHYSWDDIADATEQLYTELLAEREATTATLPRPAPEKA
jgi:glycosyltransferase involved in cell wall biosynthesis